MIYILCALKESQNHITQKGNQTKSLHLISNYIVVFNLFFHRYMGSTLISQPQLLCSRGITH